MKNNKIGFIGGGNMARSLMGGLLAGGIPADHVWVSDPDAQTRQRLEGDFGIHTTTDNQQLVDSCDVVVLAVKPQILKPVASELATGNRAHQLFLTIAAGIPTESLHRWLGQGTAIVRAMPNTPALLQSGATGLFASAEVSETQRQTAESIMRSTGLVQWVDEECMMDAVTAVSGSGPAYFFYVMEAMEQAGQKLGLSEETARLLTIQTALGAAKLALESDADPATLRQRVTSPGGTTEKALQTLKDRGLETMFEEALTAARDRARELAKELGS